MQFIQRLRIRWAMRESNLRRVRSACAILMRHVGLSGRLECLTTRNAMGHAGYLVLIESSQHVPPHVRAGLQAYFRRKLTELGELRGSPLLNVQVRDVDDLTHAQAMPADVGSGHVAATLMAANAGREPGEELADLRRDIRRRLNERRESRAEHYSPRRPIALTELGDLPAN
ncbi:hypothetical protein FVQ98_07630 [Ottowia sp. GY511]|uniref:DUF721 domain-containing protein n=1 Tax=Ottowia flava TaxID=2675430 RepID=A0ABW4KQ62_9BURK|nr:hypothetical protein [Ottowia sp. GY511]TXK29749.1 hypothetical protein FVQ98_07630 [Ottowia sp. GY511]